MSFLHHIIVFFNKNAQFFTKNFSVTRTQAGISLKFWSAKNIVSASS